MAKGLFQNVRYKGTIGGVTYRVVNGEYIASNKSSLSKETVRNSPAFANTRKLNSEFKGCAFFSKTLQNKFRDMLNASGVGPTALRTYLYPEIVAKAREAMSKTTNVVFGERSILSANVGESFTGFVPTKTNPDDVCSLRWTIGDSPVQGSGEKTLTLDDFSAYQFRAPEGATGAVVLGFGVYVPNYVYNEEIGTYEPNSGAGITQPAVIDTEVFANVDLSSTTAISGDTIEIDVVDWQEGIRGLYLVGYAVGFYKTVGGAQVPLVEGASAKVLYSGHWV